MRKTYANVCIVISLSMFLIGFIQYKNLKSSIGGVIIEKLEAERDKLIVKKMLLIFTIEARDKGYGSFDEDGVFHWNKEEGK